MTAQVPWKGVVGNVIGVMVCFWEVAAAAEEPLESANVKKKYWPGWWVLLSCSVMVQMQRFCRPPAKRNESNALTSIKLHLFLLLLQLCRYKHRVVHSGLIMNFFNISVCVHLYTSSHYLGMLLKITVFSLLRSVSVAGCHGNHTSASGSDAA